MRLYANCAHLTMCAVNVSCEHHLWVDIFLNVLLQFLIEHFWRKGIGKEKEKEQTAKTTLFDM